MRKYILIVLLTLAFILQGCAAEKGTDAKGNDGNEASQAFSEASDGTEPAATAVPTEKATPEPTATPAPTEESALILPAAINDTGKVLIQTVSASKLYLYNSYIISSAEGENIILDPTDMPKRDVIELNPAAIVSTHSHEDHINPSFTKAYDCPKLQKEIGEIQTKDFHVYNIISSHNSDNLVEPFSNSILVFEVDGLRIADMGDIGQTKLTEDQLDQLGKIDIAIMQFDNSYSSMTLENEKGFKLIEQVNPKIIIPTSCTKEDLAALEEHYGAITELDNKMEISAQDLPEEPLKVYHILNTHKYR